MNVVVLFGTESGNAESASEEASDALSPTHTVVVRDMQDFDPTEFRADALHLVVCSTYGDGELPSGAYPLYRALREQEPDLRGIHYAMFGLGDSDYAYSYSLGSEVIDRELASRGAVRVGDYGRHDAAQGEPPGDAARRWAIDVVSQHDSSQEPA